MGLAEKRALTDYQQKEFPEVKKQIDEAAGYPVDMEVRWDSLSRDGKGERFGQLFKKVYFGPLTEAIKLIAVDEMGKSALKEGLKKVIIDGSSGFNSGSFKFEGGVLTLQHEPDANVDDVAERTTAIKKLIESKL